MSSMTSCPYLRVVFLLTELDIPWDGRNITDIYTEQVHLRFPKHSFTIFHGSIFLLRESGAAAIPRKSQPLLLLLIGDSLWSVIPARSRLPPNPTSFKVRKRHDLQYITPSTNREVLGRKCQPYLFHNDSKTKNIERISAIGFLSFAIIFPLDRFDREIMKTEKRTKRNSDLSIFGCNRVMTSKRDTTTSGP